MTYRLVFPDAYIRRAKKFFRKHPSLIGQYQKVLELLELNPYHPSLRLHKLSGRLSDLSSVSINMSYRIVLEMIIEDSDIIMIDIGYHDHVYR
jgi:mRNA-degrading endonuclease YafQ of YafQ-DinJ toxin-antitoxin module